MKNKRNLVISIVVAILVYFGVVYVSDMALSSNQRHHFDRASETYFKLRNQSKKVKSTLLVENDMKAITYEVGNKKNAQINDLWNKGTITPNGKVTKTTNFSHRTFYKANQVENNKYLVLEHESARAWTNHFAYFSLLSIIYILIAILIIRIIYVRNRSREYEIALIADNLKKINAGEEINPIIVHDKDSLVPIIQEIHNLNHVVNDKNQNLHLLSRRFKGLVGHLPVGVMLLDDKGNVLIHNQAMSIILGHNIENTEHPFIDDIKTYSLSRMIEKTLRKNKNHHKTVNLINNDKFVDANVIRIAHSDEDMERQVIVILYDLTEFKQIERMQGDFVGNVSHELKTPVTAISGFSETLLNGAKDDPEQLDKFLKIINKESKRLNYLIQDILELSQIKETDEDNDEILLDEVLDNITENLAPQIKEKNLTVNSFVKGPQPIVSSKLLIEQIVDNLMINAVLYNKDGGTIDINLNHDEIKNVLYIDVEDTGIGISDDEIDRIFERFYRVDKSHSQDVEGTGLGLAIVNDAVNKLNGTIKVDSQLTVGTRFEIKIPL